MKNFRTEAIILAVGMLLLGVFIERGFSTFAEKRPHSQRKKDWQKWKSRPTKGDLAF